MFDGGGRFGVVQRDIGGGVNPLELSQGGRGKFPVQYGAGGEGYGAGLVSGDFADMALGFAEQRINLDGRFVDIIASVSGGDTGATARKQLGVQLFF